MSEMPSKLGHYRILSRLGSGGQADVYKAADDRLQRLVALKVLVVDNSDADRRIRFDREVKATARLKHDHIVTIFDVGVEEKYFYYAMEILPGGDLKAKILQGLTYLEIVSILLQICDALGFAHSRGVVHRDLKPENILFNEHGRAVVTDLGIAKYSDDTMTRGIIGTPYYMSPEQVRGQNIDGRSDLYSLGAILYRMLTRDNLFDGDDSISICNKHIHVLPPPLPAVSRVFQPILDRLVAKKPDERWQNANEVITQLKLLRVQLEREAARDQTDATHQRSDAAQLAETTVLRRPMPAHWLVLAIAGVAVIGGGSLLYVFAPRSSIEVVDATRQSQSRSAGNPPRDVDRTGDDKPVESTAVAVRGRAILQVDTEPPGAAVLFRDQPVGTAPVLLENLPAGEQSVTVTKRFFAPETLVVTLADNTVSKQRVVLRQGTGNLTILSTPGNAQIKIDDRIYDERSPATLPNLPAGEHTLEVSLQDAYAEQAFTLEHAATLTLKPTLVRNTLLLFGERWEKADALLEKAVAQRAAGNLFVPERDSAYALYRFLEREKRASAAVEQGLNDLFAILTGELERALQTSDATKAQRVITDLQRYFPERGGNTERLAALGAIKQRQAGTAADSKFRDARAAFAALLDKRRLEGAARLLASMEKSHAGRQELSQLRREYSAASERFRTKVLEYSGAMPLITASAPLADFRIGAREVTFAQWDACVADRGCKTVPDDAGWGRGERPVINVTYNQVIEEFLPWLQQKTGLAFRLPSEAEWEHAARGGSSGRYYWGANIDAAYANASQQRGWGSDGQEFTAPVGSYRANAFGLYDTSGNVWEWTSACLLKTTGNTAASGKTAQNCERRIIKGGSWFSPPEFLTPAYRADQSRFDKNNDRGFRLALDY